MRISWDDVSEEVKIATGASPREVLEALGERLGRDSEDRFLKVIGRDTFLIGEHRVVDYECVRETLMLGAVPQLMVVQGGDSIDWTNHTNITQKRDHPFCFSVHTAGQCQPTDSKMSIELPPRVELRNNP